jgi:hypothetical protein
MVEDVVETVTFEVAVAGSAAPTDLVVAADTFRSRVPSRDPAADGGPAGALAAFREYREALESLLCSLFGKEFGRWMAGSGRAVCFCGSIIVCELSFGVE